MTRLESFLLGFAVALFLGSIVVVEWAPASRATRRAAIEAGAAKYVIDENGETRFEWIDSRAFGGGR